MGTTMTFGKADFGNVIADFDGNGATDIADYNLWVSTYGSTTDLRADCNEDGIVDDAGLRHLVRHVRQHARDRGVRPAVELVRPRCSAGRGRRRARVCREFRAWILPAKLARESRFAACR